MRKNQHCEILFIIFIFKKWYNSIELNIFVWLFASIQWSSCCSSCCACLGHVGGSIIQIQSMAPGHVTTSHIGHSLPRTKKIRMRVLLYYLSACVAETFVGDVRLKTAKSSGVKLDHIHNVWHHWDSKGIEILGQDGTDSSRLPCQNPSTQTKADFWGLSIVC